MRMNIKEKNMEEKNDFAPFASFAQKQQPKLPEFPVKAFPKAIRDFVVAAAHNLQVTVDMIAVQVLTILALALQGKFLVRPKPGWTEPVNLYTLVIARPSERKSPALKAVTGVLGKFEKQENEKIRLQTKELEIRKSLLKKELERMEKELTSESDDSLISQYAEKQLEYERLGVERKIKLRADDVTPEALTEMLSVNDGQAAVISSEGGIFDTMAGRYTGVANIDVFTKAYSGDSISVDRKNRERTTVENPALTMLLTVQPEVIASIMENAVFRGRGLLARFLYSVPASSVGHRQYETAAIGDGIQGGYEDLIYRLLSIEKGEAPMVMEFSQEAHRHSKSFFEEIERLLASKEEWIEDWMGKLHGQTCRIAGLLHAANEMDNADTVEISGETMEHAIEIGRYFLEHAQAAFATTDALDPVEIRDAKYILKRLRNSKYTGSSEVSKKQLFDICRSHFNKVENMEPALRCLGEHGYIQAQTRLTGGRPTERILLNPEYLHRLEEEERGPSRNSEPAAVETSVEEPVPQKDERTFRMIAAGQHLPKKKVVGVIRKQGDVTKVGSIMPASRWDRAPQIRKPESPIHMIAAGQKLSPGKVVAFVTRTTGSVTKKGRIIYKLNSPFPTMEELRRVMLPQIAEAKREEERRRQEEERKSEEWRRRWKEERNA